MGLHISKLAQAFGSPSRPWFSHTVSSLALCVVYSELMDGCLILCRNSWYNSLLVFVTGERVVSNLARFVMIVWCFVVLVLTQSYTASLSSLLTVQQLQTTDLYLLLKNRESIGYRKGSLVQGMLIYATWIFFRNPYALSF